MQRTLLILAMLLLQFGSIPTTQAADHRCFPETGYCISGRIRSFWEQHGGLPVFGFPTGPQHEEIVEGRAFQVQLFERNRLELHPENRPPYDVLLGRLGADLLERQGRGDWQGFARSGQDPDCLFFQETGQQICGAIMQAWRRNGLEFDRRPGKSIAENTALFGLPLSAETKELVEGQVFTVQWFERARIELHPENAPPYNVLLGLLGNELRQPVLQPQPDAGEIGNLTPVGDSLFFSARTAAHGIELWRSDGTEAGTRMVRDLAPGPALGWPHHMAALGSTLLFSARSEEGGRDMLWRSDGSEAGTMPVVAESVVADPWQTTVVGNQAFFIGSDDVHGQELWATDGTAAGTRLVRDLYAGPEGSYPQSNMPMGYIPYSLTSVGNRVFFTAESATDGYGLWVSDGSSAGTRFVGSLGPGAEYWSLTALNNKLLFVGRTGRLAYGVYISDGSSIQQILDVSYTYDSGNIRLYPPVGDFVAIGDNVFFNGPGGNLWRTNGTREGTIAGSPYLGGPCAGIGARPYYMSYSSQAGFLLMDALSPNAADQITTLASTVTQATGQMLGSPAGLFLLVQGRERGELWVSDGTAGGTRPVLAVKGRVLAVQPGEEPQQAVVGTRLFFVANDGLYGNELWVSDGTPVGTHMLRAVYP